jgi:hypothetical protein
MMLIYELQIIFFLCLIRHPYDQNLADLVRLPTCLLSIVCSIAPTRSSTPSCLFSCLLASTSLVAGEILADESTATAFEH